MTTEVQTSTTSLVLIVVNFIAFHFNNFTRTVVHSATVNVQIVITHFLVSQEMTIRSNWQAVLFQEAIQFINCTFAWVGHQVLHEVNQRLDGEFILQHGNHASSKTVVHGLAFPEQSITLDTYVALAVVQYDLFRLNQISDLCPITSLDSVNYLTISDMALSDCVRLIADNDSYVTALKNKRKTHFKHLLKNQSS